MNKEIDRAIREVLEAWDTPDSPEALAGAMYQLKRLHRIELSKKPNTKPRRKGHQANSE